MCLTNLFFPFLAMSSSTSGSCMSAMEDDGNEMSCRAPNLNGNTSVTCGDRGERK